MKEGSRNGVTVRGSSVREPAGRAPLLVTPKDMPSKAVEMNVSFRRGPAFGEQGGDAPCLGPLRGGINFFI